MSRARRLLEIAKANEPAFSSKDGAQWWLADSPVKVEPGAPAEPSASADPVPETAKAQPLAAAESGIVASQAAQEDVLKVDAMGIPEALAALEEPLEEESSRAGHPMAQEVLVLAAVQELQVPAQVPMEVSQIPVQELHTIERPTNSARAATLDNAIAPPVDALAEVKPEELPPGLPSRFSILKEKLLLRARRARAAGA
jgi:hypothetical protein